jgi:DNA-binding NarL/FixJ family response regulator
VTITVVPVEIQGACRLVVVDDQLTFAEALASRLAAEPGLQVVAALGSVETLWDLLGRGGVDLVLFGLEHDPERGGGKATDALRQLSRRFPSVRVVVMAAHTDAWTVAEAIEAGISGWVPKDLGIDKLLETVHGVRHEETWIPADILTGALRVLTENRRHAGAKRTVLNRLTPRERDVLQCLVDGLNRQEIAQHLFLSPNTVRTHVQHLLRKLGVHSSLTAAAIARELGMERRVTVRAAALNGSADDYNGVARLRPALGGAPSGA